MAVRRCVAAIYRAARQIDEHIGALKFAFPTAKGAGVPSDVTDIMYCFFIASCKNNDLVGFVLKIFYKNLS